MSRLADTFARICNDDTDKVDMALVAVVAAAYQERHGAPPVQFYGLIIRAITGIDPIAAEVRT